MYFFLYVGVFFLHCVLVELDHYKKLKSYLDSKKQKPIITQNYNQKQIPRKSEKIILELPPEKFRVVEV